MVENPIPSVRNDLHVAGSFTGIVIQANNVEFPGELRGEPLEEHPVDTYADVFAAFDRIRFTSRRWLTERLDDFLRDEGRGYFLIAGKAGTGKTTVAAWLAKERKWACHFTTNNPARRSGAALRRTVAAQLQLADRFGPLGGSAETPATFADLLAAAGRAAHLAETKAVVVVDGIDKVEPVWGCAPGGLPSELPDNVYVVATLREGSELVELRDRSGGATIGADTAADDLRAHIDDALTEPELRDRVDEALTAPGPRDRVDARMVFRDELARHCAGDFLLMRYLLADIKAGRRGADNISGLPSMVWGYYSRWLYELERDDAAGALAMPVLSTLACLNEPVDLDTLCALSGADNPEDVARLVLIRLQNLVVVNGYHHRDMRVSVWHDTVRDYFTGQVPDDVRSGDRNQLRQVGKAADAAVDRIIGRFLANPALDGGYGARQLIRHLADAGRHDEMHALLRAEVETEGGTRVNAWFRARADSPEGYRADLAIASTVAADAVDADLAAPRLAAGIGLELRYELMHASVETAQTFGAAPLAPSVVRTLVSRRVWAPRDALREVRAVDDPARVLALVTALLDGAGTLSELDAADAWNLVFPPRAVGGFEIAARLLPMIAEDDRVRIRAELHRLSRVPEMPLRARMLGVLGSCEDADALLDAVLASSDDERDVADSIADLLPHITTAALDRAHTWVTARPVYRLGMAPAHRALALRHAECGTRPDWVADHVATELAMMATNRVGLVVDVEPPLPLLLAALDPARRDRALTAVVDRIAEEPPWGVAVRLSHIGRHLSGPPLERALRMARSIRRSAPGARARALAALLPGLDPRVQAAVVKEALTAPPDHDTTGRADTLALLAAHPAGHVAQVEEAIRGLPAAEQPGPLAALARHSPADLCAEALDLAVQLSGPALAAALVAIAPHIDRHTCGPALALIESIEDPHHRAEALDALTGSAREEDLYHALRAARTVNDRSAQAGALAALAHHVDTPDVPRLRSGVESRVPADSEPVLLLAEALPPAERAELLRRIAAELPLRRPVTDHRYLDRLAAVRPVLSAKDTLARLVAATAWRPTPGWDGLDVWATLDPTPELVKAARKAVRKRISGAHETAQWIAILAPHVDESEVDAYLEAAETLPDIVRHLPLAALANRLDPRRRERVVQETLSDMCRVERVHPGGPATLSVGLDPHSIALLAQATTNHTALLDAVLPRISSTWTPWALFALLLPHLSEPDRERVENVAAQHLSTHIPDPRNHCAAIARYTGETFHRALINVHNHSRDDGVKANARAAVLATETPMTWDGVFGLLSGLGRPGLLNTLSAAAPRIAALGGAQAARECAAAIEDVARWWP